MDSFRRGGLTFDVRDAGPPDGEPVVLLHGFPQDSAAWDAVSPQLHQHGLRTLALDQRGCSPMARPRGRKHYTPARDGRRRRGAPGRRRAGERARRRPRLGRRGRVGTRRLASGPDPHADGAVRSASGGDGEGHGHQRPGRAVGLHGRVPAALPARAAAAGPERPGPARHAARRRPVPRGRRALRLAHAGAGRALCGARLVPRAALRCARPGGHRPGADAARVEHGRRLPRARGHRGDGAVRRRPLPARDPGRRQPLDPGAGRGPRRRADHRARPHRACRRVDASTQAARRASGARLLRA